MFSLPIIIINHRDAFGSKGISILKMIPPARRGIIYFIPLLEKQRTYLQSNWRGKGFRDANSMWNFIPTSIIKKKLRLYVFYPVIFCHRNYQSNGPNSTSKLSKCGIWVTPTRCTPEKHYSGIMGKLQQ